MRQKHYRVRLGKKERLLLQQVVESGEDKARKITRCRILLLADEVKGKTDEEISDALDVCLATVHNIRKRYCREGLKEALNEKPRSGQPSKLNGRVAAKITAIACSTPPDGHARWSLRLLADRVVELEIVSSVSHQGIFNVLKKTNSNRT